MKRLSQTVVVRYVETIQPIVGLKFVTYKGTERVQSGNWIVGMKEIDGVNRYHSLA